MRAKGNMQTDLIQTFSVGNDIGLVSDHHVRLAGVLSKLRCPELLRCVTFIDIETGKTYEFLTINFALSAITICAVCHHYLHSLRATMASGVVF